MAKITEDQIQFIVTIRENTDKTWSEILEVFNKKYNSNKTFDAIKHIYSKNKHTYGSEEFQDDEKEVKRLKEVARTKKTNSKIAKENKAILNSMNDEDDLLEMIQLSIKESAKELKLKKTVTTAPKASKHKKNMTFELLLSDIHIGSYTERNDCIINHEEITKRIKQLVEKVLDEMERSKSHYNVEKIIIAMLGDIINSSIIHGSESLKNCEFETSRQVFEAIKLLFNEVIVPIAKTGIEVECVAVSGNHDRISEKQTMATRGESNLTYIIYKTLEMMSQQMGLSNVKFNICKDTYATTEVYGNHILYEHGDEIRSTAQGVMMSHLNKRQSQLSKIITYLRVGHTHEYINYSRGKIIINASVCGADGFSDTKGYNSEAIQVLNCYVKTNNRKNSFYRSFPICLDFND